MSVAEKLAQMAIGLTFKDLPVDIVYAAKQRLLDTIGCAIGGYDGEPSKIVRSFIGDLGEDRRATIIGSGVKTSAPSATLANCVMGRILDFNDYHYEARASIHSNEPVISPALAVGEERHVKGEELITAIVLGYEFAGRLAEVAEIRGRGWSQTATLGQYVSPIVAGKLMGLDADQTANAIGISGCHNVSLGLVWFPGKVTMMKQIINAFSAQSGVVAAQLAEKGFTGPTRIIEGEKGFCEAVAGECDLSKLTADLGKEYKIVDSWIKSYPCCAATHSSIDAMLALARKHNLRVEDAKEIVVRTYKFAVEEVSGPTKYRPSCLEEAEFSIPYCLANALRNGYVRPSQFRADKINDVDVLELAGKVRVEHDPELDRLYPDMLPAIVEIETKQGMRFSHQVNYPKGHPRNPMTDEELRDKFKLLASKFLPQKRIKDIIDVVYSVEKCDDIDELMELLVIR